MEFGLQIQRVYFHVRQILDELCDKCCVIIIAIVVVNYNVKNNYEPDDSDACVKGLIKHLDLYFFLKIRLNTWKKKNYLTLNFQKLKERS